MESLQIHKQNDGEKAKVVVRAQLGHEVVQMRSRVKRVLAKDLSQQVRMYPRRIADEAKEVVADIKRLCSNQEAPLALTSSEREVLLKMENQLGAELENIHALRLKTVTFNTDYFCTETGTAELQMLFPEERIPKDIQGIKKFLYQHGDKLKRNKLKSIARRSLEYANAQLLGSLNFASDGALDISRASVPSQFTVILTPAKKLKKLTRLRSFKRKLKFSLTALDQIPVEKRTNYEQASLEILQMYLAKVNELLNWQYAGLFHIAKKAQSVGEIALTPEELTLLQATVGKHNISRSLARLDKFEFGAEKDSDRSYHQISDALHEKAEVLRHLQTEEATRKEGGAAKKGLSLEKLQAKTVSPEQRKLWGEELLRSYGVLSAVVTFDPKRKGPAADDRWQYVISQQRKAMAVNGVKKVVFDSSANKDVESALAVTLEHEINGHVVQQLNKAKLPLRLFRKVGGDRAQVLAEAGAVYNEQRFVREVFGYEKLTQPSYIAAMQAKFAGGSYLDCVKAFFDAELPKVRGQFSDLQSFRAQKALEGQKERAINRAKRLFRGKDLDPGEPKDTYLVESKDTAYLEQLIVMDLLVSNGLEKLAYIGGMNLRNARTLLRLGMLDLNNIIEPQSRAHEIWARIKPDYEVDAPEAN